MPDQLEQLFSAVFGNGVSDGLVVIADANGSTIQTRDLDEAVEFLGNASEAWVSMQTRDEADKHYEQPAVAAEYTDKLPTPNIMLEHTDGSLYGIWFVETVNLRKVVMPDEMCLAAPLPGYGGWSIRQIGDDTCHTIEALRRALVPAPAATNNAPVQHGIIDEAILSREIEIGISAAGRTTMPGRWARKKLTVSSLLGRLARHVEGEKDGLAFLQGPAIDGKRQANAIPHLDLLVIDVDVGQSIDEVRARIQELGLFACIYSTHSHMKPITETKKDEVVKFLDGDANPNVDQVCEYLRTKKRYRPEILKGAELLGTDHTAEGIKLRLKHKPMPKFRVVLLLKDRFVIADRGATQREALNEWKERYAGACKMLGAYFDRSCTDPSRLFYTARHPKDATEWRVEIIAGKPLDIDTCDRVTQDELRLEGMDAFERAEAEMKGRGGETYKTTSLPWFFAKFAERFEVADFLMDVDGDGDRGSRASGPGRIHRCPNDDAHTDAGNEEDKGFFTVNGTESETGGAVAHCSHDSCSMLDRMKFVDMICERVGITDATQLKKWVPEVEGDEEEEAEEKATEANEPDETGDEEGQQEENRPYKHIGAVMIAIGRLAEGDKDGAAQIACNIGMSSLKPRDIDKAKDKLAKLTGLGAKVFNDEMKRGRSLARKSGEDEGTIDDEARERLAAMNKLYACIEIGGNFRIINEPIDKGELAIFQREEDFVKANRHDSIFLPSGANGDLKKFPMTKVWLDWEERRRYKKLVFKPNGDHKQNEYNLWAGLAVKPKPGDWSKMRTHMFENICQGDLKHFNFLMTWLAHIVQFPGSKMPSAVIIRGEKGVGKSKLFDWYRRLFGEHALKVNNAKDIVGGFNAHQKGLVLLVSEEAVWGGDHQGGNTLKDVISSDEMLITPKGLDGIRFDNHMRLAMISNERWVVPATDDERRFFVLMCGTAKQKDARYFSAIDKEMENGGLQAMAYELLHWKPPYELEWDELRNPPHTIWLAQQIQETLPVADRFFVDMVTVGGFWVTDKITESTVQITLSEDEDTCIPAEEMEQAYRAHMAISYSGRMKSTDSDTFRDLLKEWMLGTPSRSRTTLLRDGGERHRCYRVAPLRAIVAHLEKTKKMTGIRVFDQDNDEDGEGQPTETKNAS